MLINIEFQQLRCISESDDDGAQPYLWTELLQIDDDTIASGAPVFAADHPPSPVGARVVIKEQMKAGDSALIPDLLARLNARFRSDPPPLVRRDLILVAVLLDQRDTPGSAIVAGYDAFLSELPSEVAKSLLALSETSGAEQDAVIKTIEDAVETQVDAAIADKIGALDKAGVWLGIESPDRTIGTGHMLFEQENASRPFTLRFQSDAGDDFELDAQLRVTIDPCEDELVLVESMQAAVANMEGRAKQLANAHGGEPTPQDEQEMEQLRQQLLAERAKLKSAQEALERCRQRIEPGPAEPILSAQPPSLHGARPHEPAVIRPE